MGLLSGQLHFEFPPSVFRTRPAAFATLSLFRSKLLQSAIFRYLWVEYLLSLNELW
jgi:hypothetical protein